MTKEEMLKDDFVATHYGDRVRNWIDPAFLDGAEWMQAQVEEWLKKSGRGQMMGSLNRFLDNKVNESK